MKTRLDEIESNRHNMNAPLVQMIKYALTGVDMDCERKRGRDGVGYGYLLNQSVRQYIIPKSNIHVTKKAAQLWLQLGMSMDEMDEEYILYHEYRDVFEPKKSLSAVDTYKGAKKEKVAVSVEAGVCRPFNTLFIDEHTTPVSDVIKALKSKCGNNPCEEDIIEVLDKIHITKMLRMENHSLSPTSGRITPEKYNRSGPEDILDVIRGKCRCFDTAGYPELEF